VNTEESNKSIPLEAGKKIAGTYTQRREISSNTSGIQWLAESDELKREVVLWILPEVVARDTKAIADLRLELRRNRQVVHPNIVRTHDLLEEKGWAALVLDTVPGSTLAELLAKQPDQRFDVAEIKSWVGPLCQTLEDAHQAGLLHRDVAPDTVYITRGGDVRLAPFGVTRAIIDALDRARIKPLNNGNLPYLSPQIVNGDRPVAADDTYAFGALLFHLLASKPPFYQGDLVPQVRKNEAPTVNALRNQLKPGGESVPAHWEKLIGQCLAKTREERPATIGEVATKLGIEAPSTKIAPVTQDGTATTTAAIQTAPAKEEKTAPQSAPKQEEKKPAQAPVPTPVLAPDAENISERPVDKLRAAAAASASETKDAPEPAAKKAPEEKQPFPRGAILANEDDQVQPSHASSKGKLALAASLVVGALLAWAFWPQKSDNASVASNPPREVSPIGITPAENTAPKKAAANPPPIAESTQSAEPKPAFKTTPPTETKSAEPVKAETPDKKSEPMVVAALSPTPTQKPVKKEKPEPAATPAATPTATPVTTPQPQTGESQPVSPELAAAEKKLADATAAAEAAAKNIQASVEAQQKLEATARELAETLDQRTKAIEAAKKTADTIAAQKAKKEETLKKADAEAEAARKAAEEKTKTAEALRKQMEETDAQFKEQEALRTKALAEIEEAKKNTTSTKEAIEQARKAVDEAKAQREQRESALLAAKEEAEKIVAAAEATRKAEEERRLAEQRAEEERRLAAQRAEEQKRLEAERAKQREQLSKQAAVAKQAAEEALKRAQDARKELDELERQRQEREVSIRKATEEAQKLLEAAKAAAEAASLPTDTMQEVNIAPIPDVTPTQVPTSAPTSAPTAVPSATPTSTAAPSPTETPAASLPAGGFENTIGMKFVPVPPAGDALFSIWVTRVDDFERFIKATGYRSTSYRQPGFDQKLDHPVVNVSWADAVAFCKWLTEKEQKEGKLAKNRAYRLPTDVEWSIAVGLPKEDGSTPEARDMSIADYYPWGKAWPPPEGAGNYTGQETGSDVAIKNYNDGYNWTSPVGSFNANQFGLYDMGGNVWQWTSDWFNGEKRTKVLRGGSWYNGALKLSLLASCRFHADPNTFTDNYGFRVVLGTVKD